MLPAVIEKLPKYLIPIKFTALIFSCKVKLNLCVYIRGERVATFPSPERFVSVTLQARGTDITSKEAYRAIGLSLRPSVRILKALRPKGLLLLESVA